MDKGAWFFANGEERTLKDRLDVFDPTQQNHTRRFGRNVVVDFITFRSSVVLKITRGRVNGGNYPKRNLWWQKWAFEMFLVCKILAVMPATGKWLWSKGENTLMKQFGVNFFLCRGGSIYFICWHRNAEISFKRPAL